MSESSEVNIAIVGATGLVGSEFLKILEGWSVPIKSIHLFASDRSAGKRLAFRGEELTVEETTNDSFHGIDLALFSAGADVSERFSPIAARSGAVVVDNSSAFRMDPQSPLVVPEVNPDDLNGHNGIIANPNCSTIQLVVALKPLHDLATINRVVVSTYQSVSGAGKAAMDELFNQTKGIYMNKPESDFQENFTKPIAFNVIPHIDDFMEDGSTKEEWKMMVETKKILDPAIRMTATCVRVPVFIGHAEAINLEFEYSISADQARAALRDAPGVVLLDRTADEGYVTPSECAGEDPVYVSRVREDATIDNGLSLWVVADNLRKGAALNSVQIAEVLSRDYLDHDV